MRAPSMGRTCWCIVLFLVAPLAQALLLNGTLWYSPFVAQLQRSAYGPGVLNSTMTVVAVNQSDLCAGRLSMSHQLASLRPFVVFIDTAATEGLECQRSQVCDNAVASGASAVLEVPNARTPVDTSAAFSNLRLARPVDACVVPYVVALRRAPNSVEGPLLSTVIEDELARGRTVTLQIGEVVPNEFFIWCRTIPGYYTFWQWFCVSVTALLVVLMARRMYLLCKLPNVIARWCCALAIVALLWLLLRMANNPLSCNGVLPLYSSELDGFFFTVYVPYAIGSVLLLAFFQLEVLFAQERVHARLKRFRIPAAVTIVALIVMQVVVSSFAQATSAQSQGAVVLQAVVFLLFYLGFLVFYSTTFVLLLRRVALSPTLNVRDRVGPIMLCIMVVMGCACAIAAAGLVLGNGITTYNSFMTLELLSDLSILFLVSGIALFLDPPQRTKMAKAVRGAQQTLQRSATSIKLAMSSRSMSIHLDTSPVGAEDVKSPGDHDHLGLEVVLL